MFLTALFNARWQQLPFQRSLAPLSQRSIAICTGLLPKRTALFLLFLLYAVQLLQISLLLNMSFLYAKEVPTSLTASCLSLFILFFSLRAERCQSRVPHLFRFSAMKHV